VTRAIFEDTGERTKSAGWGSITGWTKDALKVSGATIIWKGWACTTGQMGEATKGSI